MADKYFIGAAVEVAQVAGGSIDSVDATPSNNTFTVTIGGVAISQVGDTDVATTAAALVILLGASTHPYFAAVTWTNPSAGNIVGTADTAGVPFQAALTVSGGGTGTVTDFSDTTANSAPGDWNAADNWSDGAIPANGDDVIIRDNATHICWGLDQNGVGLASLKIESSYTGRLGLKSSEFSTGDAEGQETVTTADEYRETYLKIGSDVIEIGADAGFSSNVGSQRLKIDNVKGGASKNTVFSSSQNSAETRLAPVRLKAQNASAVFLIRSGRVGIANDIPFETATIGTINIDDTGGGTQVKVGAGVTLTNLNQVAGSAIVELAATLTSLFLQGGSLRTEGTWKVTAAELVGGTWIANNVDGSGDCADAIALTEGTVDTTRSHVDRDLGTVTFGQGGNLIIDGDVANINTFVAPSTGRSRISVS